VKRALELCFLVTINELDDLNLERLDFIKIDVEGMEIEVLKGAEKTIKRNYPQMLIEIIKSDKDKICEILYNLGYKLYKMQMNVLAVHSTDLLQIKYLLSNKTYKFSAIFVE